MTLLLRLTTAAVFCVLSSGLHAASSADAISKATQEYKAGHFPEAIALYRSAVAEGHINAAVFYNLGNACFRTGDLGRAILNYERALALEPEHPEAMANLRLTRDQARALELRSDWWDNIITRASTEQYAIAAAICFWAAVFAFVAERFARRRSAVLITIVVLGLLGCAGAVGAVYRIESGPHGKALAIVTGKNVEARVATADSAGSVLALPPGSEIKILSTRGDWSYAALPNDLRGWIPAPSAEPVRL
jgi:tetratricopeptide repeat protein